MPDLNPSAPEAVGLEWFPTGQPSVILDSELKMAGARFVADATEDIDAIWVGLEDVFTNDGFVGWELEVFDLDAFSAGGTIQSASFVPTADAVTNCHGWNGSAQVDPPGPFYTLIDDTANVPGTWIGPGFKPLFDRDFISGVFGRGANWAGYYGGVSGFFGGSEQILAVRQVAIVNEFLSELHQGRPSGVGLYAYLRLNGFDYDGPTIPVRGERANGRQVTTTWFVNPSTQCGWTPTEVEQLASTMAAGWKLFPSGSSLDFPALFRTRIDVLYSAADPRVARGCLRLPVAPGWNRIPLESTWAKASGTTYAVTLRRKWWDGWVKWRFLSGADAPGWERIAPAVSESGRRPQPVATGDVADFGDALGGAFALLLERDTGAISTDSQPYFTIGASRPAGSNAEQAAGGNHDFEKVNAGQDVRQVLAATGNTDDYGFVRVLLRQETPAVDAAMSIRLRRLSDNVQIGSTIVVTSDDLVPSRTSWQTFEGQMVTPAPVDGATVYYLHFESTATAGTGWEVQVASSMLVGEQGGPPATVTSAGYTGYAVVDGVTRATVDVCTTLHTLPDPVAGLAATAAVDGCTSWIGLSWTASALGADFDRYEVDREHPTQANVWQRIANITDEAVDSIEDHEARRNVAEVYRIRVRRSDGAASVWSDEVGDTIADDCCGYRFSTNVATDRTVWFDDEGDRRYEFAENVERLEFVDRDGTVEYHELEDRLDRFDISLMVAADGGVGGTGPAATPGRRAFDPLLILAGNKRDPATGEKVTAPYVAVCDEAGNRWLASIRTPRGERQEPGGIYRLDARIAETVTEPYPFDATAGS